MTRISIIEAFIIAIISGIIAGLLVYVLVTTAAGIAMDIKNTARSAIKPIQGLLTLSG